MAEISSEISPELSKDDAERIKALLLEETPPTIGLIGVSGVGKSSTINAMFKTSLLVSHTVAGTKEFDTQKISLDFRNKASLDAKLDLQVIDAPGLGEDVALDPKYLDMYREHLPKCDVILWVLSARNRAVALDQGYLKELHEFHDKIVFGINQTDIVHPMNWSKTSPIPSIEMEKNIEEITKDRIEKLSSVLPGKEIKIMAYSASYGWNLEQLFQMLINTIPTDRKWLFGGLKNFSYKDFLPSEAVQSLLQESEKKSNKVKEKKRESIIKKAINKLWKPNNIEDQKGEIL